MQPQNVSLLRQLLQLFAIAVAALLASCGGGGGGSTTSTTVSLANSLGINTSTDTSTAALAGDGDGRWDGAGGGGGSDGGGGAGDGEFVQFNFRPTGTTTAVFSWTVINSQYGIQGQTGSMNLTADVSKGGYSAGGASGPASQQGNMYLSKSGQVNGSLPLKIGGSTVYMLFNGTRYKDAVADLAQAAGTYFYGMTSRQANNGSKPEAEYGTLKINADGTGRICSQMAYSDTCNPNGIAVNLTVDSASVFKMTSADSRNVVAYVVPRKNASGVNTASIDVSFVDQSGNKRTGAIYAMQMGGTFNPAALAGAWTYVGTDPASGVRSTNTGVLRLIPGTSGFQYVAHDTVGGTDCTASANYNDNGSGGSASTFPGMGFIQSSKSGGSSPEYVIPMGPDFFVVTGVGDQTGGGGLTVVRKFSNQTTANGSNIPC